MFRFFKLLFITAVVIGLLCFAVVNRELVEISLYPFAYSAELPKFLLTIICFMLGILVGGALMSIKHSSQKRAFKHEHKRAVALENELKAIKAEQASVSLRVEN
jgi:uncharacterized integral membrane protein